MSEQTTGSGVGRPLLAIGCVFAFFLCGGLGLAIGLVGWQANRQAQVMEELLETEDRFVELQVQVADPEEGGLFLVREPLRAAGPVPARYAGALPHGDWTWESWPETAPPAAWVQGRICLGDADMRARWVTAVTAAAPPPGSELEGRFAVLLQWCYRDGHDAWLEQLKAAGGVPGQVAGAVRTWDWEEPTPGPRSAESVELEARLRELGLVREGLQATDPRSTRAHALLAELGTVHWFDVETGQWPNEHQLLLAELCAIAGPPLSDVVWAELAPPYEAGVHFEEESLDGAGTVRLVSGDPYRLRGYHGDRRWELPAQDYGDWYDTDAVIGLLNSVAKDLGSDMRAFALPSGDQTLPVLVADKGAIEAAVEAGVLQAGDATEPMVGGKEFEQQVREALERGEIR